MSGPLAGVLVVELGVWVAGPATGGILADWGADVVKVEPPSGDPARGFTKMMGGDMETNPPFEMTTARRAASSSTSAPRRTGRPPTS